MNNKVIVQFTAILLLTLPNCFGNENIISSPVVTDWGEWGNWENCSAGHYAVGFQLNVQEIEGLAGHNDGTALNGISLLCGTPADKKNVVVARVNSSVGKFGNWKTEIHCVGLLTGFQLRSESPQPQPDDDNTAATNMNGFCTSKSGTTKLIEGDGLNIWGTWTKEQHCRLGKAVCGIQTQVQISVPSTKTDETSLNNVKMKCCEIHGDIWKYTSRSDKHNSVPIVYYLCLVQLLWTVVNSLS